MCGFSETESNSYLIWNPKKRRVVKCRNAVLIETPPNLLPATNRLSPQQDLQSPVYDFSDGTLDDNYVSHDDMLRDVQNYTSALDFGDDTPAGTIELLLSQQAPPAVTSPGGASPARISPGRVTPEGSSPPPAPAPVPAPAPASAPGPAPTPASTVPRGNQRTRQSRYRGSHTRRYAQPSRRFFACFCRYALLRGRPQQQQSSFGGGF